jgi:hypothetical protein
MLIEEFFGFDMARIRGYVPHDLVDSDDTDVGSSLARKMVWLFTLFTSMGEMSRSLLNLRTE